MTVHIQIILQCVQWLTAKLCTMKKKYHLSLVLNLSLDNFIWSPLGLVLQETLNEHSLFIFFSITLLYRFLLFSSLAISSQGWRFSICLIALYHHCHPFLVLFSLLSPPLILPLNPGIRTAPRGQDKSTGSLQTGIADFCSVSHFSLIFFFFWPIPNTWSMLGIGMINSLQHCFLPC